MPGGIELRGKKATHGAPPHPAHLAALAAMAMWPALEQLCSLTAVLRPLEAWTAKALLGLVLGDGDASPRNTAFSSYRKFAEQGGVATVAWARNARARAPATRCGAPTRARARRRWRCRPASRFWAGTRPSTCAQDRRLLGRPGQVLQRGRRGGCRRRGAPRRRRAAPPPRPPAPPAADQGAVHAGLLPLLAAESTSSRRACGGLAAAATLLMHAPTPAVWLSFTRRPLPCARPCPWRAARRWGRRGCRPSAAWSARSG